jgi:uncharacterized protein with HEPN domain
MTLINVGEKVKLLSHDIRRLNPHIPWKDIAGLRDVTAHGYEILRWDFIYETITEDIPVFRDYLKRLIDSGKC